MKIDEYIQQPGEMQKILKDYIFENLHVAIPGEIVSFDEDTWTAKIQPVIRGWKSAEKPPLLMDVPVYFFGEFVFDIVPGDECLVVFSDSCIDSWFANGGVSVPVSARKHDLSDGFAFVGFRSKGRVIEGINLKDTLEDFERRIKALENTVANHGSRITALEGRI